MYKPSGTSEVQHGDGNGTMRSLESYCTRTAEIRTLEIFGVLGV